MRRAFIATLAVVIACGSSSGGPPPVPTLAETTGTAAEFATIRHGFADHRSSPEVRLALERFLVAHETDPLAVLGHLYLANIMIEAGDLEGARKQTFAAGLPPPGNTNDWRLATLARLQRRAGNSADTVRILGGMAAQVVDLTLRDIIVEELALAAVESNRELEALGYLDTWLRTASDERHDEIKAKVIAALGRMDPGALERGSHSMQGDGSGYSTELRKIVAEVLGNRAKDTGNTKLAQYLLQSDASRFLVGTPLGTELRELATSLRGTRTVNGRAIGLLLPTGSPELRDAAADVARGVAFALGIPRLRKEDDDGTKLITRTDMEGSALEAGLEELAGSGASLIIAGIGPGAADHARDWSEQNGIPVLILGPVKDPPQRFAWVLGESPKASIDLLGPALLTKKDTTYAAITGPMSAPFLPENPPPIRCEPPISRETFPTATWQKNGVHAFLVSGPGACARALSYSLPAGGANVVALSLEAQHGFDGTTSGARVITVGTGLLPVDAAATAKDPRLTAYQTQFGARPTWWTALGHDAALLARAAVLPLPDNSTESSTEVTKRREDTRAGLASAKVLLWTTEASGFGEDHHLARSLRLVDLGKR